MMNHKPLETKETLVFIKRSHPVFRRLKLDLMATVLTMCMVAMCLGGTVLYFAILNQSFSLSPEKSIRWFQAALPISAFLIFILSYWRSTPWFAGILASLIASQIPGLDIMVRIVIMLVLSVIFGVLDWLIRRNR